MEVQKISVISTQYVSPKINHQDSVMKARRLDRKMFKIYWSIM